MLNALTEFTFAATDFLFAACGFVRLKVALAGNSLERQ